MSLHHNIVKISTLGILVSSLTTLKAGAATITGTVLDGRGITVTAGKVVLIRARTLKAPDMRSATLATQVQPTGQFMFDRLETGQYAI